MADFFGGTPVAGLPAFSVLMGLGEADEPAVSAPPCPAPEPTLKRDVLTLADDTAVDEISGPACDPGPFEADLAGAS